MVELLLAHGADPNGYVNAAGYAVSARKDAGNSSFVRRFRLDV